MPIKFQSIAFCLDNVGERNFSSSVNHVKSFKDDHHVMFKSFERSLNFYSLEPKCDVFEV